MKTNSKRPSATALLLMNHHDVRVANLYRRMWGRDEIPSKRASPADKPKASITSKSRAPEPRAGSPAATSFGHLLPVVSEDDKEVQAVTILAAAKKSRQPTGVDDPTAAGLADQILAAGKKRRAQA